MHIPENIVLQVKNTADLVDIISETVTLKRSGKNFLGLCPFHAEKTPSFAVNPDKQIFHCYGCGTGGDVFSFVMKQEGFAFPETVQYLAKRYGIDIPVKSMSAEEMRKVQERESLLMLNDSVMSFFHHNLDADQQRIGWSYLEKRGLSLKIINDFKLGYVADSWDSVCKLLRTSKISEQLAEKGGLIVKKKHGGYYDRFRNRIIFPIFDISNQVIGFGGRVMDDSKPKYLNSPETIVFNKRRSLYGLNLAKNYIRQEKSVFIVEGYIDVLSLFQQGIENTVATLGTSLTAEHVRILKGYAKVFNLVFDSDNAGIKAAQRSVEIFAREYVDARVIILPEGYDPDSYIRAYGRRAFLDKAAKALKIMPFLIESAIRKYDLSVEGKMKIVKELKEPLANQVDVVGRSLYIKELAERIQIDEATVQHIVRTAKNELPVSKPNSRSLLKAASGRPAGEMQTSPRELGGYYRFEKRIITMMLQFPDIVNEIEKRGVLALFENSIFKHIGKLIGSHYQKGNFDISDLVSCIQDANQKRIITELVINEEEWNYSGCIKLLEQFIDSRKRSDNSLARRIKDAEDRKDYVLLMELLKQKQHQARQMVSNNMEFSGGDFI